MEDDPRNNLDLLWHELNDIGEPISGYELARMLNVPYWKMYLALCHLRAQGRAVNNRGWWAI
jgi:hypothetical protein